MAITEVLKHFPVRLDLRKSVTYDEFELVEGDNGNVLDLYVHDGGVPVDLTGCRIMATFSHSGTTVQQDTIEGVSGQITIGGDDDNVVSIRLKTGSYKPSGLTVAEIKIFSNDDLGTVITAPYLTFTSSNTLATDAAVEAQESYPALIALILGYTQVLAREQSNYTETDIGEPTYIRNKPVVGVDVQAATTALDAETTLSDTDTFAFYDASASAHKKSTWANIVAKITALLKTAFFGAVTGLAKYDGAGNMAAAVANTDYAAAEHKTRHAAGAADEVTPLSIGAVYAAAHTYTYAEQIQIRANVSAAKAVGGIADAMESRVPYDTYTDNLAISAANVGREARIHSTANKTVYFPALTAGYYGFITRGDSGTVTLAPDTGVTLQSAGGRLKIAEQFVTVYYVYLSATVVEIKGSMSA